jgi:hypothetical protein
MTYDKQRKVTVCGACLQASCWHGIFCCDKHLEAGTVEKTVEELEKLGREHPSWWEEEK